MEAATNPDFYKKVWEKWGTWPDGTERIQESNGWMEVGMGTPDQSDFSKSGFTVRLDTEKLVEDLALYPTGKVPASTRDFQVMASAIDDDGNMEPFLTNQGEVIIRVMDMEGPTLKLGGLALDIEHYKNIMDLADAVDIRELATRGVFTDTAKLALNNFGNAVFPANPQVLVESALLGPGRKPVTKVSGELLHLYVTSGALGDVDSVTISVIDKNGVVVASPTVTYTSDIWKKATETTLGDHEVTAGKVSHTFVLSEQTALLYLPTWTDADGNNVSRFEHVQLHYKKESNEVDADGVGSGSAVKPKDPYFGDSKVMTLSTNSKGENIWTVTMDLEIGKTYFYYFLVDTVGDTWVIPDPKNLMVDEFLEGGLSVNDLIDLRNRLLDWYNQSGAYTLANNLFLNLPVISKLWVPGTPGGDDNLYGADDEIWTAVVDLDRKSDGTRMPDGV
jgi:hypothetical protein